MRALLLIATLCVSAFSFSQEAPPTLSFGLDQVLFGKGVIDVDLLTDIIAEKQDELKKRIIEQEILEPVFKNTSFATKNYVFSVVHDLMHEKDKNVLKKEVMEHTVNYAVVYAIAELFISQTDSLKSYFPNENFCHKDESLAISDLKSTSGFQFNGIIESVDFYRDNRFYEEGIISTEEVIAKASNMRPKRVKKTINYLNFNDLLMDCVLHAIISNDILKNKGFFNKQFYFDLTQYEKLSNYHRYKGRKEMEDFYSEVKLFVQNIADCYESFELLEEFIVESGEKDFEKFKSELKQKKTRLIKNLKQTDKLILNNEIALLKGQRYKSELLLETERKYQDFLRRLNREYPSDSILINYRDSIDELKEFLETKKGQIEFKINGFEQEIKNSTDSTLQRGKLKDSLNWFTERRDRYNTNLNALNEFVEIVNIDSVSITLDNLKVKIEKAYKSLAQINGVISLGLDDVILLLQEELITVAQKATSDFTESEKLLIENLYENFYQLKYKRRDVSNLSYIDKLRNEILPALNLLNIKARGNLTDVIKYIEQISILLESMLTEDLFWKLDANVSDQFKQLFEDKGNKAAFDFFLKFFQHLDRLDEIETYYYLLEQLNVAGEVCDNRDVANAISLITQSVDKYSKFDADNEKIDLDVELIIGALYERYGNRDKNPLNFHMTLGLNNAFTTNNNTFIDSEGNPVRNLGYASEKIGLRLNLWNFKLRYSYMQGETKPRSRKNYTNLNVNYKPEPIVSNIHTMLYASGFLYQLADLGTTKDIKSTFIGAGLGLTFYNNLSFNASYLVPVKYEGPFEPRYGAINVGFDIYFGEYLTALNKKRKENKKQKLELQYASETNTTK